MAVSASTIRQDVFTAIRALIIANKPTYTYDGTVYTYGVVAEYPRDNPNFPSIVLNKSNINVIPLTMDAETLDYTVEVKLDFYAKELHGKKAIDVAQDGLLATFIGNISTFIVTDGIIPQEDFWTDDASTIFEDNKQIINSATSTMRFTLK